VQYLEMPPDEVVITPLLQKYLRRSGVLSLVLTFVTRPAEAGDENAPVTRPERGVPLEAGEMDALRLSYNAIAFLKKCDDHPDMHGLVGEQAECLTRLVLEAFRPGFRASLHHLCALVAWLSERHREAFFRAACDHGRLSGQLGPMMDMMDMMHREPVAETFMGLLDASPPPPPAFVTGLCNWPPQGFMRRLLATLGEGEGEGEGEDDEAVAVAAAEVYIRVMALAGARPELELLAVHVLSSEALLVQVAACACDHRRSARVREAAVAVLLHLCPHFKVR
jgi:hypothetical protein